MSSPTAHGHGGNVVASFRMVGVKAPILSGSASGSHCLMLGLEHTSLFDAIVRRRNAARVPLPRTDDAIESLSVTFTSKHLRDLVAPTFATAGSDVISPQHVGLAGTKSRDFRARPLRSLHAGITNTHNQRTGQHAATCGLAFPLLVINVIRQFAAGRRRHPQVSFRTVHKSCPTGHACCRLEDPPGFRTNWVSSSSTPAKTLMNAKL